jgi:5-methyltetrahydropteroyltriglutamate--homocysteine methyltransferase
MQKNNLGFPRIGINRQLKKACEQFWAEIITPKELHNVGSLIRTQNWAAQLDAGMDLIPCNDFSYYDHVLDVSLMVGNIPLRYAKVSAKYDAELELYFAMARGYQEDGLDIKAMEMTKWFDTNYHYITPEFYKGQKFRLFSRKIIKEFEEASLILGKAAKPVIVGPVSYLLLGKEINATFNRLELLDSLLEVYYDVFRELEDKGCQWIQLDEPFLVTDLTEQSKKAYSYCYKELHKRFPEINIMLTTYFGGLKDNTPLAISLPVQALHIDLVKAPEQLDAVLNIIPEDIILSLGIVDGRNIWKNDYLKSFDLIVKAMKKIGEERIMIAPSCSLLHVPLDLGLETGLDLRLKMWMAFAKQKLKEVNDLYAIVKGNTELLYKNQKVMQTRSQSALIHDKLVKERTERVDENYIKRKSIFSVRQEKQQKEFNFPLFPTTTIGSFPQTKKVRQMRSKFKNGGLAWDEYKNGICAEIDDAIRFQEEVDLDVFVHGEFERNDMVEYFGEKLNGIVITNYGWVQSYGSRYVKPPVIFGDVSRSADMTVQWIKYAQSKTNKPVKGMLTGPVTILQWSFVRDDQPRSETALQIALAIRDEVSALESAGIKIIQIDEPAIREGLPLCKSEWQDYLNWAVRAFRLASSGVNDETQIHTHMCYSKFNDIIHSIAEMDADVITIESSRSQLKLLDAFIDFKYPNEIGPGVYDIHSPRIPLVEEIEEHIQKTASVLPVRNIWVNPDCGLKTRNWEETSKALRNMTDAAKNLRRIFQ